MEHITMDFIEKYLKKLKVKIYKIDKCYNVFIIDLSSFYYDGMRRVNYTVIQEYGEELRIFEINRQPLEDYKKNSWCSAWLVEIGDIKIIKKENYTDLEKYLRS